MYELFTFLKTKIMKKQSKKLKFQSKEEWEVTDFKNKEENDIYKVSDTSLNDSCQLYAISNTSIQDNTMLGKENEKSNSEQNMKRKRKLKSGAINMQRSEASDNISEFNLLEDGKEVVKLNEMIKASQKLSGQDAVKKQLNKIKKLRKVSVPLSKQKLTKIKRSIAYTKVCDEVTRWEPVVHSNRAAEQIVFPLRKPDLQLESFENVAKRFVTKHPVEKAMDELLNKSENVLKKENQLTEAEEKALKAMSLEEAKLRHGELMKHKALISYQEAKARRQNRIKSKRYHRLLKKDKLKRIMKEFEELEQVDAAKALEKIMEADKLRILERMTLKHRNTGKWAKMQKLRAKYNPEARSVLKEDIVIGRKLKEKIPAVEETISKLRSNLEMPAAEEIDKSIYNVGLYEDATLSKSNFQESGDIVPFSEMDIEAFANSSKHKAVSDNLYLESTRDAKENKKQGKSTSTGKTSDFIDMDFISKATVLNSYNPSSVTIGDHLDEIEGNDSMDEEESEGVKNVIEAFADEDIIAEFREDKKAADEANKPKEIDLFLPGWGTWGGKGIKVSKRKRKRFCIKPPAELEAKKSTLGHVIINEDSDKKSSVHQVNTLPFPFTNVHQFESYIRQPIGDTWNPHSSFRNLIAPKVITKAGKVIEPIDAEDFVLDETTQKPLPEKNKQLNNELQVF